MRVNGTWYSTRPAAASPTRSHGWRTGSWTCRGKESLSSTSIIVVTDRIILDRQIGETIRQFMQVRATVGQAENAGDLRQFIESGKKIIISTVQKFPFILDEIAGDFSDRNFAIIIDEAHSSQGGRTAAAMSAALNPADDPDDDTFEDQINRIIESKRMLSNASYFAFTATPKNRTLELFGAADPRPDGTVRHLPFHSYTMKQAIEEGFILDVLGSYTPVDSYYNLVKMVEDDPEFDARRAQRKLRRYVEGHEHAVRLKAEIMVDHYHQSVAGAGKVGGQARAMVVTDGITARHFVLSRHQGLPRGARQSSQGSRRLLGRARLR